MTATRTPPPATRRRRPPAHRPPGPPVVRRPASRSVRRPPARRRPPRRAGDPHRRAVALLTVLVLAFGAVLVRLAQVQVVEPERWAGRAAAQSVRTVVLPAERGAIFDRNGNELAMSVRQHTVWADPRLVTDPAATAAALAPLLGADAAAMEARLAQDGAFVYLARQVGDDVAAAVEGLDLAGVALLEESARFNPADELAASLLGTVDLDNRGVSGLELQFDEHLTGRPGELLLERAPDGATIAAGEHRLRPAARGTDLVLTLDRSLQFEVERALAEQVASTNANGGTAIVMDPRNGEVLAMASVRSRGDAAPPGPSRDNAAVTSVFEPGSVSKVVTLAAVIEEGLRQPDDVLSVPDSLQVSTKRFTDHDPHPTAQWSLTDILANSSNVGTILLGQELGPERLDAHLRRFGFGRPTGIGFPDESSGLLLDVEDWSGPSIGTIAIGQGIAVNALQMLGAFNAIANDGVLVEPRLVRATVDGEGREHPVVPPAQRRVVSTRTAELMTAMLGAVVTDGTGTEAAIPGYSVAGKTGTARKPSLTTRGYEQGAYMATFAGFVPAEDPQLSAIVVLDEPHPIFGGVVSAPVFARINQYALRLLRIPPPAVAAPPPPSPPGQAPPPRD